MLRIKTNAREYDQVFARTPSKDRNLWRWLEITIRRIKRHILNIALDDYDWENYSSHFYGPEQYREQLCYTTTLDEVEFIFEDNKLFTLCDCKPLHYVHRTLYETICNLPDAQSIAEIGVGNGKHLVNFRCLFGPSVQLTGFDISRTQLELFRRTFPEHSKDIQTDVLDITTTRISQEAIPDVVFACTVLMHIKRPSAYKNALYNFLSSASRFAVIVDRQASHTYFEDLLDTKARHPDLAKMDFYFYDSGSYFAIIASINGEALAFPFQPLRAAAELRKYDDQDR